MRTTVTLLAWGCTGTFFTMVALPLASSSPYPTPSQQEWTVNPPPVRTKVETASLLPAKEPASFSLASASAIPALAEDTAVPLVHVVRTLSIRRPIGEPQEQEAADAAPRPRIVTASLGGVPTAEPPYERRPSVAPALPDAVVAAAPAEQPTVSPPPRNNIKDEITSIRRCRRRAASTSWMRSISISGRSISASRSRRIAAAISAGKIRQRPSVSEGRCRPM
jgi:hypothetical protein